MQNPVPEEGNIVKREYLKMWEKPHAPDCKMVIVSIDTAFETTKRADYSAITVWGVFETNQKGFNGFEYRQNNIILLDARRGKWPLYELIEVIEEVLSDYQVDWCLIEKKASGISVIQELRRNPHIPLWEVIPDKDKMSRLQAAIPTLKAGCVWFPKGQTYTVEVMSELLQFPAGKNDDFVDTVTQAINFMRKQMLLSREGEFGFDDGSDDGAYSSKPKSYWSVLQS